MYPRYAERRIREALGDTPVVAINGPRQAGKTHLVRKIAGSGRTYFTLDDPTVLSSANEDPTGFIANLDRVAVDEIQRAPGLILAIKKSVDEDRRPGRFLLTGSADILSIRTARESLAGRMEIIPLAPLSRSEVIGRGAPTFLSRVFGGALPRPGETLTRAQITDLVLTGGYPEALSRSSPRRRRDWFNAYVKAIVERDVKDIANIAHSRKLPELLGILAQHSGQLVNLRQTGGQIELDHKTVGSYVDVLEQLFLLRRIQPWHRNELNRLIKTPKLHFLDSGMLASLRNFSPERVAADRAAFGAMMETFVYSELLKQVDWHDQNVRIYHYRDKDQFEVDFVLENSDGEIVGIEIKASATVQAGDFRGLRRLAEAGGKMMRLGVVLYEGNDTLPFGDGLWAAPVSVLWSSRRRKES